MTDSTAAIALSRLALGGMTEGEALDRLRIEREIAKTMREVITHDRSNPNQLSPSETVKVANAPEVVDAKSLGSGSGWAPDRPIKPPPGQDLIRRMVNTELPHGPKSNADGAGGGV